MASKDVMIRPSLLLIAIFTDKRNILQQYFNVYNIFIIKGNVLDHSWEARQPFIKKSSLYENSGQHHESVQNAMLCSLNS